MWAFAKLIQKRLTGVDSVFCFTYNSHLDIVNW